MKTTTELREEVRTLRKENRELRAQLDQISEIVSPDLDDDEEGDDYE